MVELNFTLWIQLVNFLVLIFLLNTLLFKPLLKHIEVREKKIQGIGAEAERIRAKADGVLKEYQLRVDEARSASTLVLTQARGEAEEKYRVIVEKAKKNLREQVLIAREKLKQEIPKATKILERDSECIRDILVRKILEGTD